MPVILEVFSLVIRRDRIEAVLPGGWEQFVAERGGLPPEGWWDDDLVRTGAMSGFGIQLLVDDCRDMGLRLTGKRDGQEVFKDMCVIASYEDRPTLPCDWIEVLPDGTAAFTGKRRKPRRPRLSKTMVGPGGERTLAAILAMLARAREDRFPLYMQRRDGTPGRFSLETEKTRSLIVEFDGGREAFRWAEDVVNAEWVVEA